MRYLVPSPATDRLDWLLDGLNGDSGWGGDAADVLAPPFAALIPPGEFAARMRQRAAALAPRLPADFTDTRSWPGAARAPA